MNCKTCDDTKIVEVRKVTMGRSYYSKEWGMMVCDLTEEGEWEDAPCYDCVHGDDDEQSPTDSH
jgi:hypothetical protein